MNNENIEIFTGCEARTENSVMRKTRFFFSRDGIFRSH